jgi:GNAT superfamily N-acetyltransferase
MPKVVVRSMLPKDEAFVSTCSHVNESDQIGAAALRRRDQLRRLISCGAVIQVGLLGGTHVGFAHGIPIEASPWGPNGHGLMVAPCLYVIGSGANAGVGRALMEAIEREAHQRGHAGVTVSAFHDLPGAEWFMPAAFFEHIGYEAVEERGPEVLLWKPFFEHAQRPRLLEPLYAYTPVEGKVAVDLFYNDFCQTSNIEAQRVRRVCAEFGERVVLRTFCADDPDVLLICGIPRAIYVNGREIGWGYEAPEDGIREAIRRAMARHL